VTMTNPVTGYSKKSKANIIKLEDGSEFVMGVKKLHKKFKKDPNSFTLSLQTETKKDYSFQCSEPLFILTKEIREYPKYNYFEVIIDNLAQNGYISIGIADAKFPSEGAIVGTKTHSFGIRSDDGMLYSQHSKGLNFGPLFTEGDVIGCGITGKTIIWTKNGKWVGGTPIPEINKDRLKNPLELYPTVSVTGVCQLTIQWNPPFLLKSRFPLLLDPEGSGPLEMKSITAYCLNSGDKLNTKQKLGVSFTGSSATHVSTISTIEFVCKYQTVETRIRWIAENSDWFKFTSWTQIFEDCNKVDDMIFMFYIRLVRVNQYDSDTPKEIVVEIGIQEPMEEYVDKDDGDGDPETSK